MDQAFLGIIMPIMPMPPHVIIIGIPADIIDIMRSQHSMNMSFMDASIGIISQVMPFGVIVQVILHIIIIGMPIMDIMLAIIGMFIIGIMPAIIGFGIMPPIIGMLIGIMACIGIAFIVRLHLSCRGAEVPPLMIDGLQARFRPINGRSRLACTFLW